MRTFLTDLRSGGEGWALTSRDSGRILASRVLPAFDSETRRTGLLKHTSLDPGVAMVIAPTNAIHTFFMKFPIDVAFIAKDGRILKICANLPAWRMAAAWGGYAVAEMAAGSFAAANIAAGDTLCVTPGSQAPAR